MSEEMLDVVDENDNVIGQAPRSEVLAKKLCKRAVNIFVVTDENKILAQWRSAVKDNLPRLYGAAVGGHVDAGSTYDESAQREMEEELGIKGDIVFIDKYLDQNNNKFTSFYMLKHNGPFVGWETEAEALEFFEMDELDHLTKRLPYLFTPGFLIGYEKYKEFMKKQEAK